MSADPPLPRLYLLRQRLAAPRVADVPAAVRTELDRLDLAKKIRPGQSVAIAAGSRGIRHIALILAETVERLKSLGAEPFVVPAMGSHGGGTAEGQRRVLASFGITEETLGCEIRATMDVVRIGTGRLGTPVFLDRFAAEADHIAVVNRVKPHTLLSGSIESGLLKMCLIGLGNREGARTYHRAFHRFSWMEILDSVCEILLEKTPLCFGLAILENFEDEIAELAGVAAPDFWQEEARLLEKARSLVGQLPFDPVDLLIVDEMGKEISGTGMDTNVTARKPGCPRQVTHVFVRDLTEQTHGNAQGIGLADFTTTRLVNKIDVPAMYLNSQTAYRTDSCKIPMHFHTDREVLEIATGMAEVTDPAAYKLIWIENTLELSTLAVSEAWLDELGKRDDLEILSGPMEIEWDAADNLISPFSNGV